MTVRVIHIQKDTIDSMKRFIIPLLSLGLSFLLVPSWTQEEPAYNQIGKGPLKVFILAGQSNMEGHGLSVHIKMAAEDEKTRKEFSPLMNGNSYVVRKDVWIAYGGRRGDLTVGYGAGGESVGPEIGFGWHIGEMLKEQVLLIKTAWGGHSLKEKFLPPSSAGGPGPSYTQMVKEVHDVLDHLKSYFPGYNESMGYEIVGLVWHQAWNDLIDGEQKAETPTFKSYSERQGNLLRDLRKEFKVPQMLMTVGEAGFEGVAANDDIMKFRIGQERTTLLEEFQKTMRFVKTAQFWDDDKRFTSNGGYHYNGNGKIYYFKGKAMAFSMYDMMPKITFRDVVSHLDDQSKPAYTAIKAKKYPAAAAAMADYKKYLSEQKGKLADDLYNKKEAVFDALDLEYSSTVKPAVAEVAHLKAIGDYYALSLQFPALNKTLKGVPAFDEAAGDLEDQLKSKEILAEIKIGKEFYKHIASFKLVETDPKFTRADMHAKKYEEYLNKFIIKKTPDSRYAKAAAKAAEELKVLSKPVREPGEYLAMVAP
jgi:Carbohydrate esterase, sialic acid-specific acetylesterase